MYSDFPALDFFSEGKKTQKPLMYSTFVPISISSFVGNRMVGTGWKRNHPAERHLFAGKKVGPDFSAFSASRPQLTTQLIIPLSSTCM